MVKLTTTPNQVNQSPTLPQSQGQKHLKVNEINYQSNLDSDYTEKIRELDRQFNYASNQDYYWSEPELSLLYGTSLYEQTSPAQKLALNHLYWCSQYEFIAASEASGILYNDITAGVFAAVGGYETLCQELALESQQERPHIHVFQKISSQTKLALLGKETIGKCQVNSYQYKNDRGVKSLLPQSMQKFLNFDWTSSPFSVNQYNVFRLASKIILKNSQKHYSLYLKQLEKMGEFPASHMRGCVGISMPRTLLQLFTVAWGCSPFLACEYYAFRYLANMGLKVYEHRYFKRFKDLENKSEFIPTPTAVSYYHLLDESFHTTTSLIIGRDMYQDFSQPTAYEKFLGNLQFYMTQQSWLAGLSGMLPAVFRCDAVFMPLLYRILRSRLFDLSSQEALNWMEKCLCQEHEGFHVNLKYHQRLYSDNHRFSQKLDYLWPVNREMSLMASGGSISKAIQRNTKAFKKFSQSVAA